MNGMLDVQDSSSLDHNVAGGSYESDSKGQDLSFSEGVKKNTPQAPTKTQQKFKSKHFPEPFWGHDDE